MWRGNVEEGGVHPVFCVSGALMLIAWMTIASLGMMVARYLKGLAKSHSPFGKAVWFLVRITIVSFLGVIRSTGLNGSLTSPVLHPCSVAVCGCRIIPYITFV